MSASIEAVLYYRRMKALMNKTEMISRGNNAPIKQAEQSPQHFSKTENSSSLKLNSTVFETDS